MACKQDSLHLPDLPLDEEVMKKEEYDAQYLGFSPKSLCDALYNIVITYAWDFFESTHKEVQRISKCEMTEGDFNRASDLMLVKFTKNADEAFAKLESYMATHVLHVPDKVLLPEDQDQENHPEANNEVKALLEEIEQLKQRIKQAKVYNGLLQKQHSELKAVNSEVTECSNQITQLKETSKKCGVLDLKEWTSFTMTEMQKILETMQDQPLLALPEQDEEDHAMEVAKTV